MDLFHTLHCLQIFFIIFFDLLKYQVRMEDKQVLFLCNRWVKLTLGRLRDTLKILLWGKHRSRTWIHIFCCKMFCLFHRVQTFVICPMTVTTIICWNSLSFSLYLSQIFIFYSQLLSFLLLSRHKCGAAHKTWHKQKSSELEIGRSGLFYGAFTNAENKVQHVLFLLQELTI